MFKYLLHQTIIITHQCDKKMKKKAKKKSRCASLGPDLWRMICMHLYDSPQALFRAVGVLRIAPDWIHLLERAMVYQNGLQHSNYASQLRSLSNPFYNPPPLQEKKKISQNNAENILRSVFSACCSICGARQGHKLLRPFALRVCGRCLQQNAISNVALVIRYGIHFCDFLDDDELLLLPVDVFLSSGSVAANSIISKFSTDPCDFAVADPKSLIFLWRPHFQVSERVAEQRRLAAIRLWASLRRAKQQLDLRRRRLLLMGSFDGNVAYNRLLQNYGMTMMDTTTKKRRQELIGGPYHWGVLRKAYYQKPNNASEDKILRIMDILRRAYSLLKKEAASSQNSSKRKHWFPSLPLPLAACI